ncbi:hypothetical protein [Halorubrum vacuolatum]|uniref:Phage integrase family protein n=1 Tax=Halorubrum vacuolatum TaxID=63740 RepID=A0A238W9T1_HALVU|nr:hypothetical protein [Halorubrum vacuolatum]SNR43302.1 hypothetical protein SAMN06264855_10682 [Halorubrum vacuolatum]
MNRSLMWYTMMHLGAVHSLEVDDYDPDEQSIAVIRRPEMGTTIRNAENGERLVALSGGRLPTA